MKAEIHPLKYIDCTLSINVILLFYFIAEYVECLIGYIYMLVVSE